MANQNRNSKIIRHIRSAANHRAVRTTGNIVSKGVEKSAKWMVTDHTNATEFTGIMERQQSMNYVLASMALGNRRVERRLRNTGSGASTFEVTTGWCIDHSLFIFDLLWGFIWPIVFYLLMGILAIVLIVVFNFIFFYALFWFLFS